MKTVYGLIGYPLSHSFSGGYFNGKFQREQLDAIYKLFELKDILQFPELVRTTQGLKGLNVTIPYKKAVIPYLDLLDADAEATGAVNCIDIREGNTKGYNTDITGFEKSLLPLLSTRPEKALVLGTGGSALAVKHVLKKHGIAYISVSRTKSDASIPYEALDKDILESHRLIINTTPLGMYPDTDLCPPIPYEAITPDHLLYDLIYNPAETKFLSLGKARGATIKSGLEMLHIQAEASWDIWCR